MTVGESRLELQADGASHGVGNAEGRGFVVLDRRYGDIHVPSVACEPAPRQESRFLSAPENGGTTLCRLVPHLE